MQFTQPRGHYLLRWHTHTSGIKGEELPALNNFGEVMWCGRFEGMELFLPFGVGSEMDARIAIAVTLDETVSGDFDQFFFEAYIVDAGVSRDLHAYGKRSTQDPPLEDKDYRICIGPVLAPDMLLVMTGSLVPHVLETQPACYGSVEPAADRFLVGFQSFDQTAFP